MAVALPRYTEHDDPPTELLAERGFRIETVSLPDGSVDTEYIPLTEDEYLHPKEGYVMPNNTFHDAAIADLRDMLKRRYADSATVGVYSDLIVKWDVRLRDHCPDVFVAFEVRERDQFRSEFVVRREGVRPRVIFEVVSPAYRKADREKKVVQYARARVPEYIILDRRGRQQPTYEVLGYTLAQGYYVPIAPDDEGRILSPALKLWVSLDNGQVVLEDAETGDRLLTSQEIENRLRDEQAAREAAEAHARDEQAAREAAEARIRDLEARLRALGAGEG